jgi:2-dehydropantoate 2-reductase
MRNGVCAVTGMTGKQRDNDDAARNLSIRLGSCCIRVGRALGLQLEPVGGWIWICWLGPRTIPLRSTPSLP